MKRLIAVTVLAGAMSGCIPAAINAARDKEAVTEVESGRAACEAQTFKTRVDRAQCMNRAEARMGEVVGADLANVRAATRMVLAERIDRKQITQAEADLEFANVSANLMTQYQSRLTGQQIANAQSQMAASQRSVAINQAVQNITQANQMPRSLSCSTRPGFGGRTETTCQ